MADDVDVKFGADTGDAVAAIEGLTQNLEEFSAPIRGLMNTLGELKEAFVAAFAIEKFGEFIEKMAELGTETERTKAMLGITTEEVGKLNAISLATGTSAGTMSTTLERLALNLQRAKEGTGPAAAALKALGLNAEALIKLPMNEAMGVIADKMASFADGTNKTAIAMSLLGRGGAQLIPVLDQGAKGLEELGDMATRAGTAMSADTVKTLVAMHHALVELGLSFQGIGIFIASQFGPAITGIVQSITDMVQWYRTAISEGGALHASMSLLVAIANTLSTGLLSVVFAIESIAQTAALAMSVMSDVVHGNFSKVKTDFATFQESMLKSGEQFVSRLKAIWGKASEGPTTPKAAAPNLDLGTDNSAAIAAKEIEAEIKVLQTGLQEKKAILDQELAQHKITNAQKFQSQQDYTDDAYQDEKDLLAKELALYKSGTTEYAGVKAKMLELDAKYSLDSTKITGDAIKAQQKTYQDFFNGVQSAFNSQLKGLLAGTTTWSQAFKNVLGDLIIKMIEAVEKMGFEWAAGELGKTAATVAGNTARTGADAAGAAASTAITFGSMIKSIMASAAETFAGIFGFLSPVMGPAAAGPATAGEATVAAAAASIPALAVGTPWVRSDGLAMLHAGERVVPAEVNAPDNSAYGGGGGDTHNWNISALDGQSVARFFKQNASVITKLLGDHASLNPARG